MSPFLQGCKCSELQFLLCSWAVVPSNAAGCLPRCPSQGLLVDASHMSGWSTAESSRHLSGFALDSPLHTPTLLQAITLCSTAASTLFFRHLLCASATMGVLKEPGFALQRHWSQKGTQTKHEFGNTWPAWFVLPQQGYSGHGNDQTRQTCAFAVAEGSCSGVLAGGGGRRWAH